MTEGLPIGTYNIIYADPPWRYEQRKVQGAAENHYSTMSIDKLCALPVAGVGGEGLRPVSLGDLSAAIRSSASDSRMGLSV